MDNQKLIKQLFIGKVADVLGVEKTKKLLKEAIDAVEEICLGEECVDRSTAKDFKREIEVLRYDLVQRVDVLSKDYKNYLRKGHHNKARESRIRSEQLSSVITRIDYALA